MPKIELLNSKGVGAFTPGWIMARVLETIQEVIKAGKTAVKQVDPKQLTASQKMLRYSKDTGSMQ